MAMPHPDHPFRSLKKLHETQLNDFEAMFRAGAAMAIPAAVHYCAEHGLVAPAWLTKASAELFCTILRSDTRKTIARANDVVRQLRGTREILLVGMQYAQSKTSGSISGERLLNCARFPRHHVNCRKNEKNC
jgi:hypothetical protein